MNPLRSLTESQPRLVLKDVTIFNEVLYYGSFGELMKAEWIHTPCAARMVGKVNEDLISTVELWMGLRHPAIVSLLGLYEVEGAVWMVTERLAANLKVLLQTRPKSQFPLSVKSTILYDISSALCYLHSLEPPVPFGDLKADHVYVSEDLRGKLDLGVKITGSDYHTYGNLFESYNPSVSFHVPPDLINQAFASPKLKEKGGSALSAAWDAFSFGVLCLHTIIQKTPVPSGHSLESCKGDDDNAYFHTEVELRSEYIIKLVDKEKLFLPLIESCLSTTPESRPPLDHVLRDVMQICTQVTHHYSVSTAGECFDLQRHLEALDKEVQIKKDELQQVHGQLCSLLNSPRQPHFHSLHSSPDVYSSSEDSNFFIRTSEPASKSSRTKSLTDPAYYRYRTRSGGKVDSLSSSSYTSGFMSSSNGTSHKGDLLGSSSHFDSSSEDLSVCSKVSDRYKEEHIDINSPLLKMLSSPSDPPTDIGVEDKSSSEPQMSWYKKVIKSPFFRRKKPHSLSSDSPMNVTMQRSPAYEPQEVKLTAPLMNVTMQKNPAYEPQEVKLTAPLMNVTMQKNPAYEPQEVKLTAPLMNVTMQKNPAYEPQEVKLTGSSVHGADRMPLSTSDETDVEMMQNPSYETTTPRLGVDADHEYDYPHSGLDADHEYDYIKANEQEGGHKDMEGILTANVDMTCNPSYQPIRHH